MNTSSPLHYLSNKRVLITGCCGTVGSELVRQLLEHYHVSELVAFDNNESDLFFVEQRFEKHPHAHFFLGDVRDPKKLGRIMQNIDAVFHTAAFKHVIHCERSPFEAVQTNILGVQNMIRAAQDNGVERMIFTSSDKAVNPTNVMGTSKLMGERLMTAASSKLRKEGTVFASTRFGNVLGSRGSVIPIFREQIKRGGPLTLTDPAMTRFIMTIEEAVRLVIESSFLATGGEVFVTKMPVIRIQDLAEVMIRQLAPRYGHKPEEIEIQTIGSKAGEKLYEELMNTEETRRTWELPNYFVILPAFSPVYRTVKHAYPEVVSKEVAEPYNSENETPLTQDELTAFLEKSGLLEEAEEYQPQERFWPEVHE